MSRHERVIGLLQEENPRLKTRGFRQAVLDQLFREWGEDDDQLRWLRVIPDAYEVDEGLIHAIEVEDTHRVDAKKMDVYAALWNTVEELEMGEVRLTIVDIRGGRCEADLGRWWYLRQ